MRPSRAAVIAAIASLSGASLAGAGCSRETPSEPDRKPPPPHRDVVRPIDKTPLPPLAANRGGATGKPIWALGFGGLGIDAPRAVAIAPGGDSYVAGYFDGTTDLGPAGKHPATANKDGKIAASDAF